ncbi:hypothetical protein MUP79_03900 [Candidatus Bathyarchaeota archaeon]|jgi:hypothetical protein|nr:hypothetical protein [Candidatus Bathyarchaeota archaeon]
MSSSKLDCFILVLIWLRAVSDVARAKNTLMCIDSEGVCFSKGGEDYHTRTARTKTEALQLIEAGFEYVFGIGEAKLFRKRK